MAAPAIEKWGGGRRIKMPFLPTGNAVHMQLNIKEQRHCQYLGISDDQCCKQSYMSARYGSNETQVTTSHSDMSHLACSGDSFDKEQYEKFLHKVAVSKAGNFKVLKYTSVKSHPSPNNFSSDLDEIKTRFW